MLKFKVRKSTKRLIGEDSIIYYKEVAPVEPVFPEQVVQEISQVCTLTRADIKAGLAAMESAILKHLQNGSSVRLGDLGTFRPTITGKSAESIDELRKSRDFKLNVRFSPSRWLKECINPKRVRMEEYVAPKLENPDA